MAKLVRRQILILLLRRFESCYPSQKTDANFCIGFFIANFSNVKDLKPFVFFKIEKTSDYNNNTDKNDERVPKCPVVFGHF